MRPFLGKHLSNFMIKRFTKQQEGAYKQPFSAIKDSPEWIDVEAGHSISDDPQDFGVQGNAAKIKQRGSKWNQNETSRATSSRSTHKDL
jgi:hypothetical protein